LGFKQLIFFFFIAFDCSYSHALIFTIDFKQSYFVDSTSEFNINEIETKQFTPYKDTLHLGFQKGDVWLKIEVSDLQVSSEKILNEDRILILSPFILEKISLFEKQDSAWLIQSGGSLSPEVNRICPYGMHCFNLSSDGKDQQKPFFVKFHHTG